MNHNNRSTQWNRPTEAGAGGGVGGSTGASSTATPEPTYEQPNTPTGELNRQISHTEDTQVYLNFCPILKYTGPLKLFWLTYFKLNFKFLLKVIDLKIFYFCKGFLISYKIHQ